MPYSLPADSKHMINNNRRDFLRYLAAGGVLASGGTLAWALQAAKTRFPADYYQVPQRGNVRIIHTADVHGQLNPVYFREPNINLGLGESYGRLPHLVGQTLLDKLHIPANSPEAYAYTSIDFEAAAARYGRMGGFAQIKTLLNQLRAAAGGIQHTLTLDSGDLWQGSATALWTRGLDMVEAANLLGIDVMVGHWEFTYREAEVLNNLALFNGEFIGHNVRVKEESLLGDRYPDLVAQNAGRGLYDEDTGHAFQPYTLKTVAGHTIAVIGQAFPRTANTNPPGFFPDWSFGLREDDLNDLVASIRREHKPAAILLLSHNGMDVDLKMAGRVAGLDAIFGGHTHDAIPQPVEVKQPDGRTCWVTNAGSNGKVVAVMDLAIEQGRVQQRYYRMLPVFEQQIAPDPEMQAYIRHMRAKVYDTNIVESRSKPYYYNPARVGKTYAAILDERLAIAGTTLYRRGNFMGTWDQLICDALQAEYQADIALSPGVRWGTTVPEGHWIRMEDVMAQTAMTYGESYVTAMTGQQIVNMLEQVADNLFEPDPYRQSGGDMVRVGGLNYQIAPKQPLNKRISAARLDDGTTLVADKKYQVAGWAVVGRVPEGRLIWDIVRDYILRHKGTDEVFRLQRMNHPTLIGVADNPGMVDYLGALAVGETPIKAISK